MITPPVERASDSSLDSYGGLIERNSAGQGSDPGPLLRVDVADVTSGWVSIDAQFVLLLTRNQAKRSTLQQLLQKAGAHVQ